MYHYKLSPTEIWEMTEEQTELLIQGLIWMKIIKIKSLKQEDNMRGWEHLRGLVKK